MPQTAHNSEPSDHESWLSKTFTGTSGEKGEKVSTCTNVVRCYQVFAFRFPLKCKIYSSIFHED